MIRFGTCSWKYDSWKGIVYPESGTKNYLKEYSKKFNTVEVDQWFWSLFPTSRVVLPQKKTVEEYKESVPEDFLFTIKVPNALTLTHFYRERKEEELIRNPFFMSNELFEKFLETIRPLKNQIGCLLFQFEYLNKQKMRSLSEFQIKIEDFFRQLNKNVPPIGIEIRNPNYLNEKYFSFLSTLNIAPVLLEGYYMPPITETYSKFKKSINKLAVMRLHGSDRKGIEQIANENWNQIYINHDQELKSIIEMIQDLLSREVDLFVNVNNHFEGSAPLTIRKLIEKIN